MWMTALIQELWPRARWTQNTLSLWEEAFASEPQDLLRSAIQSVRMEKEWPNVEIAWVRQELIRRKALLRPKRQKVDQEDLWRLEREEVDRDHQEMLARLEAASEEDLGLLRRETASLFPWLQMDGGVSNWSRMAVGLTWAAGERSGLWSMRLPEPNPAPGHSCETARSASTAPTTQPSSGLPADKLLGRRTEPGTPQSGAKSDCWFVFT